MKPCSVGRHVAFIFVPFYFAAFLLLINGIEILELSGDNAEPEIEFVDEESILQEVESQLKWKSCDQLSHYPLQCIKTGCNFDKITGECTNAHAHPKSKHLQKMYSISIPTLRKRRDAEPQCYYYDLSRRMCAANGCKYDNDKKKCVNFGKPSTAKPQAMTEMTQETSTTMRYKFMEKPTTENCKKYYGKPRACGYAGCGFDKWTHRCLAGRSRSNYDSKGKFQEVDDNKKRKNEDGDGDRKGGSRDGDDKRKGKSDYGDGEGMGKYNSGEDDGKDKSKGREDGLKGKYKGGDDDDRRAKFKGGDDGDRRGKSKGDKDDGKSKDGEDGDRKGKSKGGTDAGKSKDGEDDGKVKSKDGDDTDRKGKSKSGTGDGKSEGGDDADGQGKSKGEEDKSKGKSKDDADGQGKSKDGEDDEKAKSKDGDYGDGKSKSEKDKSKGTSKDEDNADEKGKSKGGKYDGKGKSKDDDDEDDDGEEDSEELEDCGKYDSLPSKCRKKGCAYDAITQTCGQKAAIARTVEESCSQFKNDLSNCVKSATDCLFNESSKECVEAQDLKPTDGGKSRKHCNSIYGKKKNCDKAGCEYDQKNQRCDAGEASKSSDSVSVTYVETKPAQMKHTAEECSELNNSPRGCLFAGCKFDEDSNKCVVGTAEVISIGTDMSAAQIAAKYLTGDECAVFKKKKRACKNAGCRYLDHNESCMPGQGIPNKEQCSTLNGKPVLCIQRGCLYDQKRKICFVSDFHEFSHMINYVRVKSKHKKLEKEECSELDGSTRGCTFAECQFDQVTKKCLEGKGDDNKADRNGRGKPLTTSECDFFNNKLRACGYAGCRYMPSNHKCVANTDAKAGCGVMNGDEGSCTEAGCKYDKVKHICTEKEKGNLGRGLGGRADRSSSAACAKFNGKRKSCSTAGCAYDKSSRTCSSIGHEDDDDNETDDGIGVKDCARFSKRPNKCIHEGCEYDKTAKTCSTGGEDGSDVPNGEAAGTSDNCTKHDGKRKSCTDQAGCKYDKSTKKCSGGDGTPSDSANCGQYKGKMNDCKKAGCQYNKRTRKCSVKEDGLDEKDASGKVDQGVTEAPEDCDDHDGKQWRCTKAGCKYDAATKKCTADNTFASFADSKNKLSDKNSNS